LFGQGQDKQHFLIFDYCQNFEFFDANPDGIEGKMIKSLTQQVFEAKLEVAVLIQEQTDSAEQQRTLGATYLDELHQLIAGLDADRFVVKAEMRTVTEYCNKTRWDNLSQKRYVRNQYPFI
jgi:type I restriction enzyme R subunit